MRNDSIETLLLRHYGSTAPAPVDLEQRLSALVQKEVAVERASQQAASRWSERRISRRRVLQLVTFSGVGISALVAGVDTIQDVLAPRQNNKPAYAL